MITKEQYELMAWVEKNGVKNNQYYAPFLDPIREYLCPYEYIDTSTTTGVRQMPLEYGLNEEAIFLKDEYDKLCEKHTKKATDDRADDRAVKLGLANHPVTYAAAGAVIGGVILHFILKFIG